MLEAQPRKRKRPLDEVDAESKSKKHKIEMYRSSRPIVAPPKKIDIPVETCTCSVIANRENYGPLAMPLQTPHFRPREIVWAKIKGSPAWPARIIDLPSQKMVLVKWFNDGRITKVYRTQVFAFLINYDKFAIHFDNAIGLKTAAREALYKFSDSLQ